MRRITNTAVLTAFFSLLLGLSSCDDEERISYGRLARRRRVHLSRRDFPRESCVYAERDRDDGRREYEVRVERLRNQIDAQGQWFEVDCKFSLLPAGIVPDIIAADIAVRYPGAGMYKVERAMGGYEISIGSGLELIYSSNGTFVREDRY